MTKCPLARKELILRNQEGQFAKDRVILTVLITFKKSRKIGWPKGRQSKLSLSLTE